MLLAGQVPFEGSFAGSEADLLIMESEALPFRVRSMNALSQRIMRNAGLDAASGADEAGQLSLESLAEANAVIADVAKGQLIVAESGDQVIAVAAVAAQVGKTAAEVGLTIDDVVTVSER